jgi:hypothetical protein
VAEGLLRASDHHLNGCRANELLMDVLTKSSPSPWNEEKETILDFGLVLVDNHNAMYPFMMAQAKDVVY